RASVAVLLAAVVGGALSAGYAVQVEDTVQPRLFGPIDRLVEPGPAVVTVFARLVVVFQQAVPEGDAHVIEAELFDPLEIVGGDPGRAERLADVAHLLGPEAGLQPRPERFFVLEGEAAEMRFEQQPVAEVDAAQQDRLAGGVHDLVSLDAQGRQRSSVLGPLRRNRPGPDKREHARQNHPWPVGPRRVHTWSPRGVEFFTAKRLDNPAPGRAAHPGTGSRSPHSHPLPRRGLYKAVRRCTTPLG